MLYHKLGWTTAQLFTLFSAAGLTPHQALRIKEARVVNLVLLEDTTPDTTLVAAMISHPLLVERPFVTTPKGTALCRPLDKLVDLF